MLIAKTKTKHMKPFLESQEKNLLFLISVGQSYHENESLTATINLFEILIESYEKILKVNNSLSERKVFSGTWNILVVVADTLQAYNDISTEDNLKDKKSDWRKKGNEWRVNNQGYFYSLGNHSKNIIMNIQFIHWDELEKERELYNYKIYYDFLKETYNKRENFWRSVNFKSNYHLHRTKLSKEDRKSLNSELRKTWETTPAGQFRLEYILDELAALEGSLAAGLFEKLFSDQEKNEEPIFIIYPSEEEAAFSESHRLLRETQLDLKKIIWLPITLHEFNISDKKRVGIGDGSYMRGFSDNQCWNQSEKFRENTLNLWLIKQYGLNQALLNSPPDFTFEQYLLEPPVFFKLPIWRENLFVERTEYENKLSDVFSSNNSKTFKSEIICIFQGLGGFGKTTLAQSYLYKHANQYNLIAWIDASEPYRITESIINLSRCLGTISEEEIASYNHEGSKKENLFNKCLKENERWFSMHGNWLLIFDDVRNYQKISKIFPKKNGHIIITSKLHPANSIDCHLIGVNIMTEDESLLYIKKVSMISGNEEILKCLVRLLGYYPLALAHAGVYLNAESKKYNRSLSDEDLINKYIKTYETESDKFLDEKKRLTEFNKKNLLDPKVKSVIQTIKINLQLLSEQEKNQNLSITSSQLLFFCAYQKPNRISKLFITDILKRIDSNFNQEVLRLKLIDLFHVQFITDLQEEVFSLHPVVSDSLKYLLINSNSLKGNLCIEEILKTQLLSLLEGEWTDEVIINSLPLIEHLVQAKLNIDLIIQFYEKNRLCLKHNGYYKIDCKIGKFVTNQLPLNDSRRLKIDLHLASNYFYLGDYQSCEELSFSIKESYFSSAGTYDNQELLENYISSLYLLSAAYRGKEKFDPARKTIQLAEQVFEEHHFKNKTLLGKIYFNYGAAYMDNPVSSEADIHIAIYKLQKGLQLFQEAHNENYQERIKIRLIKCFLLMKQNERALSMLQEIVLESIKEERIKAHYFLVSGQVYASLDSLDQALEYLKKACELSSKLGLTNDMRRANDLIEKYKQKKQNEVSTSLNLSPTSSISSDNSWIKINASLQESSSPSITSIASPAGSEGSDYSWSELKSFTLLPSPALDGEVAPYSEKKEININRKSF